MNRMATPTLERLKAAYSSALYAYFRVTNLADSCHHFLQNSTEPPTFHYRSSVTESSASKRLKNLRKELKAVGSTDEAALSFLNWRIAETQLLRQFWHI